ncbi:MAG: PP2C family protein-serine/threonine phosphatase [Bacteroidia bacterium]
MALKFTLFGNTHVGSVRDHNEDNFAVCSDLSDKLWSFAKDEARTLSEKGALLVVADGMGGTNAGEVASDIAQNSVKKAFEAMEKLPSGIKERESFLKKVIIQAHQEVVKHQEENLDTAGMGTTLVIAWIIDEMVHAAWSGDSRCYVYEDGKALVPFSEDHSIVWELVKKGDLTAEEARLHPNSNIISQSLGDPKNAPKPDVKTRPLFAGNKILVCSDGLNGMISDGEIQAYLQRDQDVAQTCRELVEAANAAGGHDNITCLLLEVKEGAAAPVETPGSQPTQTAVLRKKVKYNYAIIAVLVIALALLAYQFLRKPDPESTGPTTLALQTMAVHPKDDLIIDINTLLAKKVDQIEKILWPEGKYQLSGTMLTLSGPVSTSDTLFIRYTLPNEEGSFLSPVLFTSKGDETGETESEVEQVAPASGQDEMTPAPVQSPQRETAPTLPRDTTRVQAPPQRQRDTVIAPQRPRLNPINNTDTTK